MCVHFWTNLRWIYYTFSVILLISTCSYIQYSSICARLVRQAIRPELQQGSLRKPDSVSKLTKWENGKPIKENGKF